MALYSTVIKDVTLTAAATKTMWQLLTAANDRAKLVEFGISFDGAAAAVAVDVDLLRQTTAGTMTTAVTEAPLDPADGAASVTASVNATVEPTAGDILSSWQVPPNGGVLVIQYPLGREPIIGVNGRLGLRVVTADAVTPGCSAYVVWDE